MDNTMVQPLLIDSPPRGRGRPSSISPSDMKVAEALITSGIPAETVAKRFGVDRDLVYRWISRYGWISPAQLDKAMKAQVSQVESIATIETNRDTIKSEEPQDALSIAAEIARKQGLGAMHGFVSRATPVFSKFTPDVPETIGEASILLKMIKSAAGLEASQTQQTNVQVNVSTGPWGKASANGQSFRAMEVDTSDES